MKKTIKIYNTNNDVTYFKSTKKVYINDSYKEKKKETRGVWFSTVANIDLPQMKDTSIDSINELKKYLDNVINTCLEYNLNTVVFQVRPVNDTMYVSEMNPFSQFLTGHEGMNPGFDPFGYFCSQAKINDIDVHAWINPYRAGRVDIVEKNMTKEEFINSLDDKNFCKRHPECTILTKKNLLLLDPSNKMVREFVSESILEVCKKYDVKAVHIDDYFYPYEDINDPDEEKKMKANGFSKVSDFRRNNVDLMIELIHNKLATLDRKVEFGISPFGIYRTNTKYFKKDEKNSEASWKYGSNNDSIVLTNYAGLYADVYKWMKNKWIDYVCPQIYFNFNNVKVKDDKKECLVKYADLCDWWSKISKKTKCKLYIGQAMYRMGSEDNFLDPYEINNQLKYNQKHKNISGTIFFTYKDFIRDDNEVLKQARENLKKLWKNRVKAK